MYYGVRDHGVTDGYVMAERHRAVYRLGAAVDATRDNHCAFRNHQLELVALDLCFFASGWIWILV